MPTDLNGAAAAAKRFMGGRASGYEARRSVRPFWAKEHEAVRAMLSGLPRGSSVLDIPVGTGRFAEIYQSGGFQAAGIDASPDMLEVARAKIADLGLAMEVEIGDALNIRHADRSFDAVVCTRLVNWFLPSEMSRVIHEAMRVCRACVIVSVELAARNSEKGNKPHEPAVFAAAVKAAGATELRRVEIERDYWMIQLVRA